MPLLSTVLSVAVSLFLCLENCSNKMKSVIIYICRSSHIIETAVINTEFAARN